MTVAAATNRAWRADLAAALRPAAVVRLKRVRTSHIRTQLCTTVALRFLHQTMHYVFRNACSVTVHLMLVILVSVVLLGRCTMSMPEVASMTIE